MQTLHMGLTDMFATAPNLRCRGSIQISLPLNHGEHILRWPVRGTTPKNGVFAGDHSTWGTKPAPRFKWVTPSG